ncbi:MAG: 50S ribosomal protein L7ae [Candidatus Diapherotrites archaeon]|nr:50S ribosomal protein L7ae [Candidatus Diapherotrites archaeon]
MAKEYIKFSVSPEMVEKTFKLVENCKKDGKIRIGINEATKAIEGNAAKLIILAEDIEPAEIAMHIPLLCKEKNIPFTYVPTKKELGAAAGIEVSTSAIAVVKEGDKKALADIIKKAEELSKEGQ